MEALDAFTGPLLAAVAVFIVEFISWGRFRDLKRRMSALEAGQSELRAEVVSRTQAVETNLRTELGRRIDKLADELAVMRSDLTRVALVVGAREEPNAG